jgi:hypothetical protein
MLLAPFGVLVSLTTMFSKVAMIIISLTILVFVASFFTKAATWKVISFGLAYALVLGHFAFFISSRMLQ